LGDGVYKTFGLKTELVFHNGDYLGVQSEHGSLRRLIKGVV